MLTIIADEHIAKLHTYFENIGHLTVLPAQAITPAQVNDADILLVRTQTKVDAKLLADSKVSFVGTATAGFDHIDTSWLTEKGITWATAAGCNAQAVADYVLSCIAALRIEGILTKHAPRIGIIGAGHVGKQVAYQLQSLGFEVVLNDPPLQINNRIINCDVICVHAALHKLPLFPSYHLIDYAFLQQQKPHCVLINAARGEIVDSKALLQMQTMTYCIDVWENEPDINLELVKKSYIATPHIAGYSLNAKQRATHMLYEAICNKFGIQPKFSNFQKRNNQQQNLYVGPGWEERVLQIYDVRKDSQDMKTAILHPMAKNIETQFLQLRAKYIWRREL